MRSICAIGDHKGLMRLGIMTNAESFKELPADKVLFNSDAFGHIAGLVNMTASNFSRVVGNQLQWNNS